MLSLTLVVISFLLFVGGLGKKKNGNSKGNQCHLSLLMAGKSDFEVHDQVFINVKNRGGLWNVKEEVVCMSSVRWLKGF